jgi:hypothetical protein
MNDTYELKNHMSKPHEIQNFYIPETRKNITFTPVLATGQALFDEEKLFIVNDKSEI